ncbi:MAG TPA: MFS transporter [Bacteroidia bacterium]|jgi:FHS family L-fucose permease-like MFS transporter
MRDKILDREIGSKGSNGSALAALISVFFFWGFLAASNGIFIPFCKTHFHLSQFQSQLIDSAFYGAYFIGSLVLYLISMAINRDIINRLGYKRTIIYGLLISVIGALTMIPAVNSGSFGFILGAFFIIALGFSLQQTSANPLVLNLGDVARGSARLNFAGSVNSLGTTLGPILVSLVLFGKMIATDADKQAASINSINTLYVILAIAFGIAVLIMLVSRIPKLNIEEEDKEMKVLRAPMNFILGILAVLILIFCFFLYNTGYAIGFNGEDHSQFYFLTGFPVFLLIAFFILLYQKRRIKAKNNFAAEVYPQVTYGMIAIFVYVGVEVTIQSNMGTLLKHPDFGGLDDSQIAPFISLYWGSLMIGRWTGAIATFKMSKTANTILTLIVPFLALSLVLFMNHLSGANVEQFYLYPVCVALLVAAFFMGRQKPALTLLLFGSLGMIAMLVGLLTVGKVSVYAFLCGGLFCSIMWPCIFSLAIAGIGKYTGQASAFLIMMILGGAFIPPMQGLIADKLDIHTSYIVPVFCFGFLAFYAWKVGRILKKQGIDYDANIEAAH